MNTTVRQASDTEVFGLKIAQLVLPFEDHNLSIFNKIQKRYMNYGSSVTNENQDAALGVTATLGFIFLIFWTIFKHRPFKLEENSEMKLDILGVFNLASLLFATVGGFAVILAFVKINGQTFHYFLLNIIQTMRRPSRRLWQKRYTDQELKAMAAGPKKEMLEAPSPIPNLSNSRIRALSLVVNTGGYFKYEE